MRTLLAELVGIIVEQNDSEKELIIQAEVLKLVVAAFLMRLDDTGRVQLKNEINEAFAVQYRDVSSHTAEKRMLQGAVEELFSFQAGLNQKSKDTAENQSRKTQAGVAFVWYCCQPLTRRRRFHSKNHCLHEAIACKWYIR